MINPGSARLSVEKDYASLGYRKKAQWRSFQNPWRRSGKAVAVQAPDLVLLPPIERIPGAFMLSPDRASRVARVDRFPGCYCIQVSSP